MKPRLRSSSFSTRMIVYGCLVVIASATSTYLWRLNSDTTEQELSSKLRIKNNDEKSAQLVARGKIKREQDKKERERLAKQAADESALGRSTAAMHTANSPCNTATSHTDPMSIDVLVNKKHCLKPIGFVPSDLRVTLGTTLRVEAAFQYEAMISDATAAGMAIRSTSSYRSYDQQVSTYNYWVGANGSVALADTVSARPGYSEHQTGLTVDVASGACALECFGTLPAYLWMQAHAANYGFVERYPSGKNETTGYNPEPWHYRFVGSAVARDMKDRSIMTLEEYWNMPGGDY